MPLFALLAGLLVAPADTIRVVLVATTDIHGQITDWEYFRNAPSPGGLSRAATVIDSLRDLYPGQVVLMDAGGALGGGVLAAYFTRVASRDPHPVIDAMNTLGYDVATPGEEEFEGGTAGFTRALAGATFPWVSGNLRALPADTLALAPYTVVTRNGVRVAVTGFTTPGAMVWYRDQLRDHYRLARLGAAGPPVFEQMRHDADFVVALSHSGLAGPSSYDTTGIGAEQAGLRLSEGAARPDLVVLGHSPVEIRDTLLNGVHYVAPPGDARGLAIIRAGFLSEGGRLRLVRLTVQRVSLEEVRPSPRVTRRLADVHGELLGWLSSGIGESTGRASLAAGRVEDVALVRFIQDVQRRAARADLSAVSVWDLRAGLDEGEITQGEVYRLYPREYTLRAVRLSGADLKAYLEQSARYWYADSTGLVATNRYVGPEDYDLVSGARYTVDLGRPAGSRITRLEVAGRPVQPTDSFTLALSSYRQQGGGGYRVLAGAPVVYDRGQPVRDLLVDEIRRRQRLDPSAFEGTDWELAPADLAQRARALFVREPRPAPVAAAPATPAPLNLPRAPSRAELEAREAERRAAEVRDSIANAPVVTLRLPAEPGAGGTLARLLADAYRHALRTDLAIVALDEGRDRLPAGGVTAAQIEAAVPEVSLLTVSLTGKQLEEVFENLVSGETPCCELAGGRITVDPRRKPWERVRSALLMSGGKFEDKATYTVAISSRLLRGAEFPLAASECQPGKGCGRPGTLADLTVERSAINPANAFREYLAVLPQPLTPPQDSRVMTAR